MNTALLVPITGVWMRLRDPQDVRRWFAFNAEQANGRPANASQLATVTGKSRQFIHMLLTGAKTSCRPDTAVAIEIALGAPAGSLFAAKAQRATSESCS